MRLSTLGSLFLALFGAALLAAAPARALETKAFDATSFKAAQDEGKPILVDIYAPWCPTCKAQQEVFKAIEKKPEFADVTVFKVDFDNSPDVVKSFKARTQSTLIAFKGAKETGRSAGDSQQAPIEALLKTALE